MQRRVNARMLLPAFLAALVVAIGAAPAAAVPGSLLGTVTLPGNGGCNVAGTFDGTYYLTIQSSGCASSTLGVYQPPVGGNGAATLVATKSIVDSSSNPVTISALAWDASRSKVWGGFNASNQVWLIDIGNPTVSGNATATFQFNPNVGGFGLVDGMEWDDNDDTLYYSPDVDCNVYQFSLGTGGNPPLGTLMNTVTPKNSAGNADCSVSGVEVGSANSLYIGRDGAAEIRRVDKTNGAFISQFATTSGRVEDLACDPVTYAPLEAILAKDAFNSLYEAFEVEEGTCPLPGDTTPPEASCTETTNPHGTTIPPAGNTTLPGPQGGQNEDGYWLIEASDDVDPNPTISVVDSGTGFVYPGPFSSGDKVKYTEANGATPSQKTIGSPTGQAGAVRYHLTGQGDMVVTATDASGNASSVTCLVPPPPK